MLRTDQLVPLSNVKAAALMRPSQKALGHHKPSTQVKASISLAREAQQRFKGVYTIAIDAAGATDGADEVVVSSRRVGRQIPVSSPRRNWASALSFPSGTSKVRYPQSLILEQNTYDLRQHLSQ